MPITAVDLERELSSKRRECDAIRERYKHLLIECGDLEYRIRDLRGPAASEPDLQAVPVTQPDAELVEPPDQSSAGLPVDVDLRGASDHVERFRRLARHTGQEEWHIDAVCQWIVDAGASSATLESVRSRLYVQLKEASDFVKVRPRVFRFSGSSDSQTGECVNGRG